MNFDKSTLQLEASASTVTSICVGRCGCLRRSVQHVLITLSVSPNSNKNRKEQNFDIEVLLFSLVGYKRSTWLGHFKGVHLSQVHQPNRMLVNMVGVPLHGWCTSTRLVHLYTVGAPLHGWCTSTWLMQFYSVGALETSAPPKTTRLVHLRQVHPLKRL